MSSNVRKRIAVLGLYNSGSTVVAGMLHRLGVNMGAPYWMVSEEGHPANYYESRQLSGLVRWWWMEPVGRERVGSAERRRVLQSWMMLQEYARPAPVGAKHPLLSLCGEDLLAAWGPGTCFIRAGRPLAESIDGIQRRGWFRGFEVQLQQRLWNALAEFERSHGGVVTLEWNRVKAEPEWAARELASIVGIEATEQQIAWAAGILRREEAVSRAA